MAKQVRKTVARNVRKTSNVRAKFASPTFRPGTTVAKYYAALTSKRGASIAQLQKLSGQSEAVVRSYLPMFEKKYGCKLSRDGERGESVYFLD